MTAKAWLGAGVMLWAPALLAQELPRVMIQTELGSMEVEVDTVKNPDAAGNFLIYVDQGAYQGSRFHRTVRAERLPGGRSQIEGIQGEVNPSRSKEAPPMALENKKDTGLSQGGTSALARSREARCASAGFLHSRLGTARAGQARP